MKQPDLARVVKSLQQECGVEAVFLYGSRATGMARPDSDTDICVITDQTTDKRSVLSIASDTLDTTVFWDLPLAVRYRVIKDGKPLYVKNKLFMHRVTVRTVLSYLDFRYLLDRHVSRMLS